MRLDCGVDIHNHFTFTLRDAKTNEIKQTAKAENVVLNSLFTQLNNGGVQAAAGLTRTPCLCVGTGVGTPSVADTSLFNQLAYKQTSAASTEEALNPEVQADGITKSTFTCTFSELEAIGNLTEVGLGNLTTPSGVNPNYWYTHAMITDSENNPITINKTDTDILDCTAVVYVKITTGSDVRPLRVTTPGTDMADLAWGAALPVYKDYFDNTAHPARGGDTYNNLSRGGGTSTSSLPSSRTPPASGQLGFFGISSPPPIDAAVFHTFHGMEAYTVQPTPATSAAQINGLTRWTSALVQSTVGNLSTDTWLIKGIRWANQYWITFPNHTLYPPKELTFTLTGDGSTTDFNLPIPELMTSNVVVTVDGATLASNAYTFSGKNFEYAQAWASTDSRYVVDWGMRHYQPSGATSTQSLPVITFPYSGYGNLSVSNVYLTPEEASQGYMDNPMVFDFETPKTVNTFKGTLRWNSMRVPVELDYSTNGTAWENAAVLDLSAAANEVTFSPISARYWRINKLPSQGQQHPTTPASILTNLALGFDNVAPTIRFNTAPASGAAISITAFCEYPMKNANWRIDPCTLDIYFQRSGS